MSVLTRRMLFLALCAAGCAAPSAPESVTIPGSRVRFELVPVPGGRGLLPFWISRREVTWAEFDRFYEFPDGQNLDGVTRPSSGKSYLQLSGLPPDFMQPDRPVTNLRYHSALAYCEWLSKRTGMIFRLPTEAEWELACGADSDAPMDHAWVRENSGGETHPGGGRKPNALGLHDMLGNAWEYCLEPLRPPDFAPVLRGGAWSTPAAVLRTTLRIAVPDAWSEPDPNRPASAWWFRGDHSQGFRLVRMPETAGPAEREAYARKIEVTGLAGRERIVRAGTHVSHFSRVTGEVRNGGDRALDELALKVYPLDPEGKPHLEDVSNNQTRRPTFNVCMPALVSSAHSGDHVRPLGPGERRSFAVDVPLSFDPPEHVRGDRFGASILHLRFSPAGGP